MLCQLRLNKWIAGASGNSTLIVPIPGHHDVTVHSPPSTPGVLDQPVVLTLIVSITNNKYAMIQSSAAARPVQKKEETNAINLFGKIDDQV